MIEVPEYFGKHVLEISLQPSDSSQPFIRVLRLKRMHNPSGWRSY